MRHARVAPVDDPVLVASDEDVVVVEVVVLDRVRQAELGQTFRVRLELRAERTEPRELVRLEPVVVVEERVELVEQERPPPVDRPRGREGVGVRRRGPLELGIPRERARPALDVARRLLQLAQPLTGVVEQEPGPLRVGCDDARDEVGAPRREQGEHLPLEPELGQARLEPGHPVARGDAQRRRPLHEVRLLELAGDLPAVGRELLLDPGARLGQPVRVGPEGFVGLREGHA